MSENLIFLHIPKNGGTTFHSLLERYYSAEETFSIQVVNNTKLNTDEFINLPVEDRSKITLLKGHMIFGLHKYLIGDSKYITFLRKPEQRILSFYKYVISRPNHRLYKQVVGENMNFNNFVEKIKVGDLHNAQVRMISGIDDTGQNMLEKALENIENHFSLVGLLEQFDESLILLKNLYNWKIPFYRIRNKAKNRDVSFKLDEHTKEVVKELNAEDYVLYKIIEDKLGELKKNEKAFYQDLIKLRAYNKLYSSQKIWKAAVRAKKLIS